MARLELNYVCFCVFLCVTLIIGNNCDTPTTRTESFQVVIIGAGASGIAAATRLMERGMTDITILEAENRMGGRVYSLPFDHGVLDMGGQWVMGEKGNVVYDMAEKLNMLESSKVNKENFYLCFVQSSGQVFDPELSNMMMGFMEEIQNASYVELDGFSGSLGEYYTPRFEQKIKEKNLSHETSKLFLRWYEKYRNAVDASDSWFETSARVDTEFWNIEGNQELSWKFGGYANVLNLLMNKYTSDKPPIFADKKVKYNKEVTQIDWENNTSIVVHCSDGSSYQAPHVIVTVSLGVLKERANTMFHPPLPPAKLRAIEGLGFGTLNKIYVKFPYRWWPNEYNGFSLLWNDNDLNSSELPANAGESKDGKHWIQAISGFTEVDNYPLVLLSWIVGPASRYMETLSDEQITLGVVYVLEKFMGRALNVSIPHPEKIIRPLWSSNPHFRGSYSFLSMATESLNTSALHLEEPITDRNGMPILQFAGEATNLHHFGTVHGAVETGRREADRILAHYDHFRDSLEDDKFYQQKLPLCSSSGLQSVPTEVWEPMLPKQSVQLQKGLTHMKNEEFYSLNEKQQYYFGNNHYNCIALSDVSLEPILNFNIFNMQI